MDANGRRVAHNYYNIGGEGGGVSALHWKTSLVCRSEVTVAVLGQKEVGKTTFIAHSLVSSMYHVYTQDRQ